jgi:predicted transcriptional regulator
MHYKTLESIDDLPWYAFHVGEKTIEELLIRGMIELKGAYYAITNKGREYMEREKAMEALAK